MRVWLYVMLIVGLMHSVPACIAQCPSLPIAITLYRLRPYDLVALKPCKYTVSARDVDGFVHMQGSSMGQFYREHLQPVRLNRHDVNWTAQDLSYLRPDAYNALIRQKLAGGHSCQPLAAVHIPPWNAGCRHMQHLKADPCCCLSLRSHVSAASALQCITCQMYRLSPAQAISRKSCTIGGLLRRVS